MSEDSIIEKDYLEFDVSANLVKGLLTSNRRSINLIDSGV